ncbi:hypothetical protein CK203_054978 [Vitis vinifera]|uniref:Uncharacterized protein n=1 Tax=Vitis vinifera TaxID=29760 RepID=A0A438GND9_VITVI|nr:hypothetical protein CK203_054978 [Vitis vinifera]
MDIVSSHSWSRSNQTRRRSTSLSLKKPKQRRVGENAKEEIGKKSERKQSKNRGEKELCEISQPRRNSLRKRLFVAKSIRNTFLSSAKVFAAANPRMAHECHFAAQEPPFRSCEVLDAASISVHPVQSSPPPKHHQFVMARTRGAKSSSPSSRKPAPREAPVQASTSEPPRPEVAPLPSPVPSPEPSPVPSPAPPTKPQASHPPPSEPQIPSGPAPEEILRRPMLTQPPIEGNLDCRTRPFHSELCFETAAFQLRLELEGSFQLLQRYRME